MIFAPFLSYDISKYRKKFLKRRLWRYYNFISLCLTSVFYPLFHPASHCTSNQIMSVNPTGTWIWKSIEIKVGGWGYTHIYEQIILGVTPYLVKHGYIVLDT